MPAKVPHEGLILSLSKDEARLPELRQRATGTGHMGSGSRFAYVLADVFTDRIFGGNPLAVFPDARGIGEADMQLVAREFNLSETVFVLPPAKPHHAKHLRIFTPAMELPFAGHPTVGAALVLAESGALGAITGHLEIVLEETVGPIAVRIVIEPGQPPTATLTSARLPQRQPTVPDRAALARLLNLAPAQLTMDGIAPAGYSAGLPFTFVPVANRAALAAARIDHAVWRELLAGGDAPHVYVFTMADWQAGREVNARMFAPALGIVEDPATGAAAAALAGFLADLQHPPEGERRWQIRQGEEMGRPSRIELAADMHAGRLSAVRVGGNAVIIGRGELMLSR
jgi:trans-2,3-dihydro-3-hydroxyanthranilate isomerase